VHVAVQQLCADQELRTVQLGHTGRVAEHRRGILGERRPAGRGGAEVRGTHLVEPESRSQHRRGGQNETACDQSDRDGSPDGHGYTDAG
jgi:hypothetical protein